MRQLELGGALVLLITLTPRVLSAQDIPLTISQAEAEGAGFGRADSLSVRQSYFAELPLQPNGSLRWGEGGGTSERRCVSDSLPAWSLRSGDFIVRGRDFEAGVKHKALWIPLHGSSLSKPPLMIRAARMESPADSVRVRVEGLAHGGSSAEPLYGYPSEVLFPSAGRWLVIATAGHDWGCFVFDVKPRGRAS
jgi:hypothetical protein